MAFHAKAATTISPGLAKFETEEEHNDEGHDEHEGGSLENSASESSGFNVGGSLFLDNGYVGLAYGRLDRLNGIPGHGHKGEDDGEENMEEEHADEQVLSELKQNRWQLLSELQLDSTYITGVNTRIGYTDYQHVEIHDEGAGDADAMEEEHEEGTVFKNTTWQARVDLIHAEISGWKGALLLETKGIDFEAIGEEAFTPPSKTKEFAVAIIEEKQTGNILWQMGARIERVSLSADDIIFGHEHGENTEEGPLQFDTFDFTPISASAGLVWNFTQGYNFGLSLAHSERAPSAAELFSAGPHLATQSFEAGALFEIHDEDGDIHLEYVGAAGKETSNNIDISLRKFEGDIGFVVNLFYNKIANYYSLTNTGLTTEDLFEEADTGEEHSHEEVLPVYLFEQDNAILTGLEVEFVWQLHTNLKWTVWGDTINAELESGEYLPRSSPTRLASQFNVELGPWAAELSAVNYFKQDHVAANETTTQSYTMVDTRITFTMPITNGETTVYLAANNLSDEEARVHTSVLKNHAPLPGRNIKFGLYSKF